MNIGENIKKYRKVLKLTQEELAERINKSEKLIQNYERDLTTPPIKVLNELAKIFKVPIEKLIYGEEEHKNASQKKQMEVTNLLYQFRNAINESYIWESSGDTEQLNKCIIKTTEIESKIIELVGD